MVRDGRTETSVKALTASVNARLSKVFLSVGGTYSLLSPRPYGLTVSVVMPLGERTIAMATGDSSPTARDANVEVSRSIPQGPGYGYRARSSDLDAQKQEAAFYYQNNYGYYGIEAAEHAGGIERAVSRARVFRAPAQTSDDFALADGQLWTVEVPGAKGIPVYVNNQELAKTDRRGFALLPWLVAYNRNSIRLDDNALPVDETVESRRENGGADGKKRGLYSLSTSDSRGRHAGFGDRRRQAGSAGGDGQGERESGGV